MRNTISTSPLTARGCATLGGIGNISTVEGGAMSMLIKARTRGRRAGMAVALLALLGACDPQPVGDTSCSSAVGCEIVALTAQEMRADIGENYGGGVVLRNASALGQTLVVDLTLPLTAAAFKEPAGAALIKGFAPEFAGGFCEGAYARDFFALGNKVRVRGFSRDSQLVADRVITSCGEARK